MLTVPLHFTNGDLAESPTEPGVCPGSHGLHEIQLSMNHNSDPLVLPLFATTPAPASPAPSAPSIQSALPEVKPVEPAAPPAPSTPVAVEPEAPLVVVAPVAHGRSFILRSFYNQNLKIGQMLVKLSRVMTDAAIEVLEIFCPEIKPGSPSERGQARFFLGDLKVDSLDHWVLIFEIRVETMAGVKYPKLQYRMLHPSGKVFRDWDRLDLSVLKLRTTEKQREDISKLTGIIYKAATVAPQKQVVQSDRPQRQHDGRRFNHGGRYPNNLFDRAGVTPTHLKKQLKPQHAQVRSDLQRRLPPSGPPASVSATRHNPDQHAMAEVAAKAAPATPAPAPAATPAQSVGLPGGAAESVVEIQTTLVTSAQPVSPVEKGADAVQVDAPSEPVGSSGS